MVDMTNFSNVTNFGQMLAVANTQTSGYFWFGMNMIIFLIIFVTMATGFGWESAFFSAGFVSILISVFLMYLGLESMRMAGIMIGGIVLLFIILMWSNKND